MNSKLRLEHIPPKKWCQRARWKVLEPFHVNYCVVKRGFITDGVSTPWAFACFVSPTGKAMKAAILHDYILSRLKPSESRCEADAVFYMAMRHTGISRIRAMAVYKAVRVYGIVKVWWYRLWH